MNEMSPSLRFFLRAVDGAMLVYWGASALACLGMLVLPAGMMYGGYGTAHVDAWNWSFAPLDLTFAIIGLWSVKLAQANDPRWRQVCLISLVLTMCAGGMAISYWAVLGEFDFSWWSANLLLLVLPMIWLPALLKPAMHAPRKASS
ncbi:MAG: DUF5360 family protein [Marinomonas sp.]